MRYLHTRLNTHHNTEVYIAPVTHTPPESLEYAKEIPLETRQRLKLDHERSWIVTNEVNRFTWKGPDIRRTQSGEWAYGHLPPGLTKAVIEQIRRHARQKEMGVIERDEVPIKRKPQN